MKKQNALDIEKYLNSGCEYDNEQFLEVWLDAIKTGIFTDDKAALSAFVDTRNALFDVANQPARVLPVFEENTAGMSGPEKLFLAQKLFYYFKNTVFNKSENDKTDNYLTGISKPLGALIKRLERETGENKNDLKTIDLRAMLKDVFKQEIERLPEYLKGLEAKERLNILCKMMPYILPKVESVHFNEGEPYGFR